MLEGKRRSSANVQQLVSTPVSIRMFPHLLLPVVMESAQTDHQYRLVQRERYLLSPCMLHSAAPPTIEFPPCLVAAKAETCPILPQAQAFSRWPSFSSAAASRTRDSPCRKYPAMSEHNEDSQSFSCSFGIESTGRRTPDRPSGWPSHRSCCRRNCNCRCSCCRSRSRRPVAGGVRPSREACCKRCIGSSRYAISVQLEGS